MKNPIEITKGIIAEAKIDTWNQNLHCLLLARLAKEYGMPKDRLAAYRDAIKAAMGGNASAWRQHIAKPAQGSLIPEKPKSAIEELDV